MRKDVQHVGAFLQKCSHRCSVIFDLEPELLLACECSLRLSELCDFRDLNQKAPHATIDDVGYVFSQAVSLDSARTRYDALEDLVLSSQGRTSEFVQEIREARRLNLLGQMNQNIRFRSAFSKARLNQQLPPDLAN